MRILFFLLIAFFVIIFEADAIEIVCKFHFRNYDFNSGYACDVQSIKLASSDIHEVTSVTGPHESGKSSNDVKLFYSEVKSFNLFPRNIETFLKNVESVALNTANLTTLTKFDLQSLGSPLRHLWIPHNKVEALEADVFDYTPNLEYIHLQGETIQYVERGTFVKLYKLKTLFFNSNPCHSGGVFNDRFAVINLITTIESKCINPKYKKKIMSTTEVPTTSTTERNCAEELMKENLRLSQEHNIKIDELNTNLQVEKDKNSILDLKLEKSNNVIEYFKSEVRKLQLEVEKANNKSCKEGILEGKIMKRISEMEATIKAELKASNGKMEAKFEETKNSIEANNGKMDSSSESVAEKFVFINATCSVLDYKLDLLNRDCLSKSSCRQP